MYLQGWLLSLLFYALTALFVPRLLEQTKRPNAAGRFVLSLAGMGFGVLSLRCPYIVYASLYSHLACLCLWGVYIMHPDQTRQRKKGRR